MFKTSLKQLLRTPGKATVFFLLMLLGTMMLTISAAMLYSTGKRIAAVDGSFTTIGMVEQAPEGIQYRKGHNDCVGSYVNAYQSYSEFYTDNVLNFEGANYIYPPKSRAYYISYHSNWMNMNSVPPDAIYYVIAFSALEDAADGRGRVKVENVYGVDPSGVKSVSDLAREGPQRGNEIILCQHNTENIVPLKRGSHYVAGTVLFRNEDTLEEEYAAIQAMYSTQCDIEGGPIEGEMSSFPTVTRSGDLLLRQNDVLGDGLPDYSKSVPIVDEILPDGDGTYTIPDGWNQWIVSQRYLSARFPVVATDALELLPSYHNGSVEIVQGRAITPEEFASGAKVVLMPELLARNVSTGIDSRGERLDTQVGNLCAISLNCTLYGYAGLRDQYHRGYSFLNVDGETYSSFYDGEYEVVGTYRVAGPNKGDMLKNMLIIPAASLPKEPQSIAYLGPMNSVNTSFMIPNGTIEEFDRTLHEAVPEAEHLKITYDDGGYTEIMGELTSARDTAMLLLAGSIFAELSVTALALYIFVAKEKRRTAIERSLGLTRRQCRASIMTGLMLLTVTASALGCLGGGVVMTVMSNMSYSAGNDEDIQEEPSPQTMMSASDVQKTEDAEEPTDSEQIFSRQYSLWAANKANIKIDTDARPPVPLYMLAGLWQSVLMLLGSLLLVNRSMRIQPIMLLGQKG